MTDAQLQDIYARLDSLTAEVNSLKLLTGTIGTSQVAIAQLNSKLDDFAETANSNFAQVTRRFNSVDNDLNQLKTDVTEILRILRDRNGGSGI